MFFYLCDFPLIVCAKFSSLIITGLNIPQGSSTTSLYFPLSYIALLVVFRLPRYQDPATRPHLRSATLPRYFAFTVILELVVFTLIGGTFSTCERSAVDTD